MTLPDFLLLSPARPTDITITYSQTEGHK